MPESSKREDCLNTIRLIAALQVVYVHCLYLLHLDIPIAFTKVFSFFAGVPIFFTLSGFLIWWSIGRSKSFGEYCRKRFWRIYPELWAAVAVEICFLLIFYRHAINWTQLAAFTFGQSTIFQFWTPEFLRGYGCGCPNGALWTICVLIQYYVVAYFLFKFLHDSKLLKWIMCILVFAIIGIASRSIEGRGALAFKLYQNTCVPYLWMFAFGAFLAEYWQKNLSKVISKWGCVCVLFAILIIIFRVDFLALRYGILQTFFTIIACLWIGYKFPKLNLRTDVSYGVYIYHMTFVNMMITLGWTHSWQWLFLAVGLTLIAAYVSTKTIGAYAGTRKSKMRRS